MKPVGQQEVPRERAMSYISPRIRGLLPAPGQTTRLKLKNLIKRLGKQ
jgi:hypothetical protein